MKKTERIAITLIVVAICLWFLMPTIKWYLLTSPEDRELVSYSKTQVKEYAKTSENEEARQKIEDLKNTSSKALQLGLDLKGGMSILLDVDKTGLSETEIAKAIDEDIEILKNRIDQYGVSEPEIRKQGTDQILIELAGTHDPERIDSFLKGKGNLSFHLADSKLTNQVINYFTENPDKLDPENLYCPLLDSRPDKSLYGRFEEDEYGIDQLVSVMVVNSVPAIDGNYLVSADYQKDQMNRNLVTLKFTDEGGDIFYDFTKANVGKTLTIIMDGKIRSAANIKEAIRSNVSIEGFTLDEAQSLAILLKTANLPAPVSVASQQIVGATLGEDTVNAGLKAIAIGFALVVITMLIIYGKFGLFADFALLMNLVMIIATLAGLGSTMTLTGIAGIILTLGMAVDSNVIIFERIKEELNKGILPAKAVKNGFDKALWTILDSNITTIIAAVVLIIFGSSAVKGFATTLAIGIVCSMFTSLFVCHLLVEIAVGQKLTVKIGFGQGGRK